MKKSTLSLKPAPKAQPSIASFFAKPASSRLQLKKTSKGDIIVTAPKETDEKTKISKTINVVDLTGDNNHKNLDQFSNSKRKLSLSPENGCFKGGIRSQISNGNNDKGKQKICSSANKKAANLLLKGKYHKSDEQCVPSELVSPLKKTKFSNKEQKSQFSNSEQNSQFSNEQQKSDFSNTEQKSQFSNKQQKSDFSNTEQKSQFSNTEQKSTMLPQCSKSEIDYYLGEDFDGSLLEETIIIDDFVSVAANNKVEVKGKDELDFAKEFGGSNISQEDEINDFFKDDWEGDMELEKSFVQEDELDLTQWQRCEVISVSMDSTNRMKILILKSTNSENKATCTLEGSWMETKVSPGDTISLLAMRAGASFRITSSEGLLVTQPDQLVSGTAVVGSLFCSRKAVLGDRFKGVDGGNRAMVIGSLVHELFQVSLSKNLRTLEEIKRECRAMLKTQQCVYMLYDAKMSDGEAIDEMMKFTPQIARFIEKYVVKIGNQIHKNIGYQNKRPPPEKTEWDGSIDGIVDIEENIWSPHIGVKGKIDVTIEVTIHDKLNRKLKRLMPLELKTGKASVSAEHRGQVILYTMMMENLGSAIPPHSAGLLLYLRESISMHEISAGHSEKRDLIMLRNDLARYLASWSQKSKKISQKESNNHKNTVKSTEATITDKLLQQKAGGDEFLSVDLEKCFMDEDMMEPESKVLPVMELPEPINHHSACGNCPYLTLCSIHLSASDHNLSETHPLMRLQPRALGHLTSAHQKYLLHWTALLALEERDRLELSPLKDIWTVALEEREKRGKCLINMAVDGVVTPVGDRFEHSLRRNSKGKRFEDLQQSLLQTGEYVILSTKGKVAIALGTITHIDTHSVSVILDRDLLTRNVRDTLYCLDLYESQSMVIYNLTNLGLLMDDTEISTRLRSIVIDMQPATFDEKISRRVLEMGKEILQRLNPVQQRAVLKALATKDYILIRGMPGTGKTQTLVALVEVLVRLGKSVLITSQTHSAVDNVLVRLLSSGVSMLRLGSSSRVQPQLLPYCEVTLTKNCHTPDDLHQIYSKASVVGVTCLGSGHSLFTQRKFDVCIVDESTQVLQCSVLRPLYAAHKFVLVGDPDQLPPIVRSNQAKSHGLDESLFKRLDNAKSTLSLCLQYRMNRPIMELANELSYEGKLQAANSNVEQATIKMNKGVPNYSEPIETWLKFCVSPALGDSVIFLDTGNTLDLCAKYAENLTAANGEDKQILRQKDKCANVYEAALVKTIVNSLLAVGVLPADMGVIAPYRDQVALLKKVCSEAQHLKASSGGDQHPLEVNTVDQFQGRDKSVIIYSCTKSRSREQNDLQRSRENEILEDHRRLTVAITRSKHKLIMVGDVTTLNQYTPLRKLIDSLKTPLETLNKQPLGHILSVSKLQKDGQFDWEKIIQVLR